MTPYGTLPAALAYHTALGNAQWLDSVTYSDPLRTAAMLRGSRSLDGRYGRLFPGAKFGGYLQERAWPRVGAYDSCAQQNIPDGYIPPAIEQAAYELALIELVNPGATTPELNLGRITKSESVDGAASRSFFSPGEMNLRGNVLDGFRPTLLTVSDLMSCYLKPAVGLWAATVV